MRFVDAMTRFGSDKPDVRYGLEIRDVTSILVPDGDVDDDVEVGHGDANLPAGFLRAIRAGRSVRAVRVPRLGGELSRKEIAQLGERISEFIGGDLSTEQVIVAALKPTSGEVAEMDENYLRWVSSSPSMRFLGKEHSRALSVELDASAGDIIALVGDPVGSMSSSTASEQSRPHPSFWRGCEALGKFRAECAHLLADLGSSCSSDGFEYDFKDKWNMMWVVDFPLFEEESDASYVQSLVDKTIRPLAFLITCLQHHIQRMLKWSRC